MNLNEVGVIVLFSGLMIYIFSLKCSPLIRSVSA